MPFKSLTCVGFTAKREDQSYVGVQFLADCLCRMLLVLRVLRYLRCNNELTWELNRYGQTDHDDDDSIHYVRNYHYKVLIKVLMLFTIPT